MRVAAALAVIMLASLAATVASADVRITLYDDGLSCPGNCDAHVVFHPSMNATQFAHDPRTRRAPFSPCVEGGQCRLCVRSGGRQCFITTYRGAGPAANTFDFTPAFFDQACRTRPRVAALKVKCDERVRAARELRGSVNCIRDRSDARCRSLMDRAIAAQAADRRIFEECRRAGQEAFNAARPDAERRAIECAYEHTGTGRASAGGRTWRRLLPGACRTGTFVGRDGLDCCSGEPLTDGALGQECRRFYLD